MVKHSRSKERVRIFVITSHKTQKEKGRSRVVSLSPPESQPDIRSYIGQETDSVTFMGHDDSLVSNLKRGETTFQG
jgi:hypothetical protein